MNLSRYYSQKKHYLKHRAERLKYSKLRYRQKKKPLRKCSPLWAKYHDTYKAYWEKVVERNEYLKQVPPEVLIRYVRKKQ